MPLDLPEDLRTDLVVCGLSGKRYTGVRELHDLLRPLVLEGKVALLPKDGLCSYESLNRYVKWARAAFFVRVEAPDDVRTAKGWRAEFGPEDFVRDEHWTETALDDWDGWDAVIHNDGDEDTLLAHANDLAPRINALVANPELSKHKPIPNDALPKREHSTPIPACMVPGWGVNPPTKNQQGTYDFKASDSQPPVMETGRQAARPESRGPARPENPALEAATARAATAAERWDGGGKKEEPASGKSTVDAEDARAAASAGATRVQTDEGGGEGRGSAAQGHPHGQTGAGGASGSSGHWGAWGSWDAPAGAGSSQWSSSRSRWGERREAWEGSGSGWGGGWSWTANDESQTSQPWRAADGEAKDSEAAVDAGGWGGNWSSRRGGWSGGSWGNWSS